MADFVFIVPKKDLGKCGPLPDGWREMSVEQAQFEEDCFEAQRRRIHAAAMQVPLTPEEIERRRDRRWDFLR